MDIVTLLIVAAALVAAVIIFRRGRGEPSWARNAAAAGAGRPQVWERYTSRQSNLLAVVPRPGDKSPLTPALAKAVDVRVPPRSAGEHVPYDNEEVRRVAAEIVARVNRLTPAMQLRLIGFDGVQKTVDSYKTIAYTFDVTVYSTARNVASRVAAAVDVSTDGRLHVRDLRVHGAADPTEALEGDEGTSAAAAASNGIGFEEQYAAYEPAVAPYVPQANP